MNEISINTSALIHNYRHIKNLAPHSKILAMVKANAYGHGLIHIAKNLPEANGFGVACLEEAIQLRKENIKQKIVIMRGVYNQEEFNIAKQLKLDLVIHSDFQLNFLSDQLTYWIKINTGMNRLGFTPEEFLKIYPQLKLKSKNIILFTHFSDSEQKSDITQHQINLFNKLTQDLPYEKSLANSGGILNYPESHQDWIRPGLILYGVSPCGINPDFKPVMNWTSKIIALRNQKKSDAIGYNKKYICEENMPIALVGVGYGDGYPQHAQNGTPVLINNIKCPIVGRVSMDMLAVDIRNISTAKIGDPVTLWGEKLYIQEVAKYTASSVYELLCNARLRSNYGGS